MQYIKEILEGEGNFSLLIELPVDRMEGDMLSLIGDIENENTILITANKPYKTVKELLKKMRIDTGKISFIDCVGSSIDQEGDKLVSSIIDIADLSALSIMVKKYLEKIEGRKFLVLDAIHTLWIYCKSNVVARFAQSIIEHSYQSNTCVVFFIVDVENKDLLRKIAPLFDHFIRVGET